jgi:hypothetical protein
VPSPDAALTPSSTPSPSPAAGPDDDPTATVGAGAVEPATSDEGSPRGTLLGLLAVLAVAAGAVVAGRRR